MTRKHPVDNHGTKVQMRTSYHPYEQYGVKKTTIIIVLRSHLIISIHPISEVQSPQKTNALVITVSPLVVGPLYHLNLVLPLNSKAHPIEQPTKTGIIPREMALVDTIPIHQVASTTTLWRWIPKKSQASQIYAIPNGGEMIAMQRISGGIRAWIYSLKLRQH
jgi:hypothetical protein